MNGINMIITSYEQYIREAIKIIKNNLGPIRISSYGIFFKPDSLTREFLDLVIKEGNSTILVGTSYSTCTPDCPHCIKKNVLKTIQYFNYKFFYNVHFVKNVHLKLISRGNKGIVGGINLTGSGWTDAAVVVKNDNLLPIKISEFYMKKVVDEVNHIGVGGPLYKSVIPTRQKISNFNYNYYL